MAEREDMVDEANEAPDSRRRVWVASVLLLLLLLLLTLCSSAVLLLRLGPEEARFVARSGECLACHTEMLPLFAKPSTHMPFVERKCTSCHEDHAKFVGVTITGGETTASFTSGTWLRWGPLRWGIDWFQRAFLGVSEQDQRQSEQEALGPAQMRASADRICWTCHGGLSAQTAMGFQHQPFAADHCLSCHNPHASDDGPLLIAAPEVLCVSCHPIGPELARDFTHQPAKQLRCLECHEAHASEWKGILTARQRDLCFTCHPGVAGMSLRAVQHQPFDGDNCTGCHEPHGASYSPLLLEDTPELCYRCHTTIEPRFRRESRHPVDSQLDCPSCHESHASAVGGLLVRAEPQLCTGCHQGIGNLAALPVQHEPFADSSCTGSCHVPHGSSYEPLLKNPQPNLCYVCHPGVATDMAQVSHHPEECSLCHEVHAGSYDKLLPANNDNGLCYECHPKVGLSYIESPHRLIRCNDCHGPHGSQYGALLSKNQTLTCIQCHEETSEVRFVGDGDSAHRSTPTFYDHHADKPLSCTSTCHGPHGTEYDYMIIGFPWYWDGLCLQCHPGVGLRF